MEMKVSVKIVRLRDGVSLPAYASGGAAAMDLTAALDAPLVLEPHVPTLVPTGIAIALPSREYAAFVFARSGLASRQGLALANGVGVIDADYRGELLVAMINHGSAPVSVAPGQRIAQLAVMPVCTVVWEAVGTLDETERGTGGFGSTGTH